VQGIGGIRRRDGTRSHKSVSQVTYDIAMELTLEAFFQDGDLHLCAGVCSDAGRRYGAVSGSRSI
jgi:hypothetical protein